MAKNPSEKETIKQNSRLHLTLGKLISHALRMPSSAQPRVALRRTPDERRKKSCLRETWRRIVERGYNGCRLDVGAP